MQVGPKISSAYIFKLKFIMCSNVFTARITGKKMAGIGNFNRAAIKGFLGKPTKSDTR